MEADIFDDFPQGFFVVRIPPFFHEGSDVGAKFATEIVVTGVAEEAPGIG